MSGLGSSLTGEQKFTFFSTQSRIKYRPAQEVRFFLKTCTMHTVESPSKLLHIEPRRNTRGAVCEDPH